MSQVSLPASYHLASLTTQAHGSLGRCFLNFSMHLNYPGPC